MVAVRCVAVTNFCFSRFWKRLPARLLALYVARKFAAGKTTMSLVNELPPGLAVVAFNPGVIRTNTLQSMLGAGASAQCRKEE